MAWAETKYIALHLRLAIDLATSQANTFSPFSNCRATMCAYIHFEILSNYQQSSKFQQKKLQKVLEVCGAWIWFEVFFLLIANQTYFWPAITEYIWAFSFFIFGLKKIYPYSLRSRGMAVKFSAAFCLKHILTFWNVSNIGWQHEVKENLSFI